MNDPSKLPPVSHGRGGREILALTWIMGALALLFVAMVILDGSFPVFSLVWLVVPLIALIRTRDARRIGVQPIRWGEFMRYALLNLAGSLFLMVFFEPWSHTYQRLYRIAISTVRPDTTFGWLVRFPGPAGWASFLAYAGCVTLFAEELFFRGWLLQWLKSRMGRVKAILLQATLFALPQMLAALFLPPIQGILYATVYAWLATGVIGGWAANRTQSIWPSLAAATIYNVIMVIVSR
jgi:membrane protease YdiL (CAAX protease family)